MGLSKGRKKACKNARKQDGEEGYLIKLKLPAQKLYVGSKRGLLSGCSRRGGRSATKSIIWHPLGKN